MCSKHLEQKCGNRKILCLHSSATTELLWSVYPTGLLNLVYFFGSNHCHVAFCATCNFCCFLLCFVADMMISVWFISFVKSSKEFPGQSHLYPEIRSLTPTLFTSVSTFVVSGLQKYNLEYHELRSTVKKHSQIPSKLLCFIVGQKKLSHTCSLDLRKNNDVNVYV